MDLHVWTTDEEWVIAKDEEDANAVLKDLGAVAGVGEVFAFRQVPDDAPLAFAETEGAPAKTMTAREWCDAKGRGWLAGAW